MDTAEQSETAAGEGGANETRMGLSVAHLEKPLLHGDITDFIIGCAFDQRALQVELLKRGFSAETERRIVVHYKGIAVGEYVADLIVNACVLIELKVATTYNPADEAQLLNELKATGLRVGLPELWASKSSV